jgi:hypothetical protein
MEQAVAPAEGVEAPQTECAPSEDEVIACPEYSTPCYPITVLTTELGFLNVMDHTIQFSQTGTEFNYRNDGGQDILFPLTRFSADLHWNPAHTITLLYQPLELNTREILSAPLQVDETLFPANTPMDFTYFFSFYRMSYLYDLKPGLEEELSLGFSLQIRNANIEFASQDGTRFTRQSNIGPVPLLKCRWRQPIADKWWWGGEVDGIYAPISYLNGSQEEIVGALLDASLRTGLTFQTQADVFLNVRYLGGGAVGTNETEPGPGDGYVKNWLHFLTFSVGLALRLF